MNWISKILRVGEKIKTNIQKKFPTKKEQADSKWISCCAGPTLKSNIFNNEQLNTCPECNKHFPFTPRERFDHFFGKNNYEILDTPKPPDNPIDWPDKIYEEKLKKARKLTGHHCAVMVVQGIRDGIKVTSFAIDSRFIGGSINNSSGEAIVSCFARALEDKTPVVGWSEGGGQAMYQSGIALQFMVKTVLAVNTFKKESGQPYVNIYTNKCYGGITASFAAPSLSDITFAEPSQGNGTMVGFAGQAIVRNQTREELSSDFQSSNQMLEKGFIDHLFHRKEINDKIINILKILLHRKSNYKEIKNELEATKNNSKVGEKISA